MRLNAIKVRGYLSVALAMSMVTVFSFASMASASSAGLVEYPIASQGPTGLLNVRGSVTINGNPAASGGTVVSGNSIATGDDGSAAIELGPLGRIELRSNTGITAASLAPGSEALTLDRCGSVIVTLGPGVAGMLTDPNHGQAHLQVISGQVHVKYNGNGQDLKTGDSGAFDSLEQVSSAGSATFAVWCGSQAGPAGQGNPSLNAAPGGAGGAGGQAGASNPRRKWFFIVPLGLAGLGGLAYGIHQWSTGGEAAAVSPSVP